MSATAAVFTAVPLPVTIQFMRYCAHCDALTIFVAGWACDAGLMGCCLGCGEERIAPFTRVNSEG
jgi:hypothetical protein